MPEAPLPTETMLDHQHADQLGGAIGGTALIEAGEIGEATNDVKSISELINRSPEWLTDGLDENKFKQVRFGNDERFYHVDLSDNPIESGYPLGDLVSIIQIGKRSVHVWRIEGEQESAQFILTDDTFEIGENGDLNGWWTTLEVGQEINITDNIGDDSEGEFDIKLTDYEGQYEMALRNKSNIPARSIRAESSNEIEERVQMEEQRIQEEQRAEESRLYREWLTSQEFDNFVDFSNYETFLSTSVDHYLRTPERTGNDNRGVKYVEVHVNGDGEAFIIPAPRSMRPYGATTGGHHSIVDELRVYEGYDEFPNYMKFVDSCKIDTDTIRSKGYLRVNEDGELVLELNQNRGTPTEREDFRWLEDATRDAKNVGIDKVILEDFSTKDRIEVDLSSKAERKVYFSPRLELFSDPNIQSNSLTVGILEDVTVGQEKIVKAKNGQHSSIKKVREINLEGRQADLKIHGPLIDRIAMRRDGFKDTEYPITVHTDDGDVKLAVTYQFDQQYGEFGISFRYESEPPDSFQETQDAIAETVLDNIAMQFHKAEKIAVSISRAIGKNGKPSIQGLQAKNPYYFNHVA